MAILVEGVVENGQIRLSNDVVLPENSKVYVVIAEAKRSAPARIYSPRLMHPEQAADFRKQVLELPPNDQV
jgi:hypothetical protein